MSLFRCSKTTLDNIGYKATADEVKAIVAPHPK